MLLTATLRLLTRIGLSPEIRATDPQRGGTLRGVGTQLTGQQLTSQQLTSQQLKSQQVADLVADALALSDPCVRPIDEGGDHLCWSVGDAYVVRFTADGARLRREIAVRDLLRDQVPVPRSVISGVWASELAWTLDERVPGVSAESRSVSAVGERDLAEMLRGLRSISSGVATELGVPHGTARPLRECLEQARVAAERLALQGQLDSPYELGKSPPSGLDTEPVLLHADLKGEHLLVDESGGISGVLDWSDAEIGDPATDIAGLAISVGAPAAIRSARRAGYGADVSTRALFLARCDTVIRLDDRLNGDDDSPERLLRTQLARAFSPVA